MFKKPITYLRRHGLTGIAKAAVRQAYLRAIRPLLPGRNFILNGVEVAGRLFDDKFPIFYLGNLPDYEGALCRSLREEVGPADQVVIVGGGKGVTAAIAGELVGPEGHVTVYEPDRQRKEKVAETVQLNGVGERVTVHQAYVGTEVKVEADLEGASQIHPSDLPSSDVLELDCEGLELEILRKLNQRPRIALVETHGYLGADTEAVCSELKRNGYKVERVTLAEERLADFCSENDIRVVTARRLVAGDDKEPGGGRVDG